MKYITRDFGEVELDDSQILELVQPILGYESYQKFALLFDENIGTKLVWLQSLEETSLCFILADPSLIQEPYQPELSEAEAELLGEGELLCLPIAVIGSNFDDTTVNLRNPIVINTSTKKAIQALLSTEYPLRKKLFEGGDISCYD